MPAQPLFARAAELQPENSDFDEALFTPYFALGELTALEQELRTQTVREPLKMTAVMRLCDVLAAQNRSGEAIKVLEEDESNAGRTLGTDASAGHEALTALRPHVLYSIGAFDQLETNCRNDRSLAGRVMLLEAPIEQNKLPIR